jgi:hypothetical protein
MVILDGLLGDGTNLVNADSASLSEVGEQSELRLEQALRRRLERMREPQVFHPIEPRVETGYPDAEPGRGLTTPDVARRATRRRGFDREMHKRLAKHIETDELSPHAPHVPMPKGMTHRRSNLPPTHFRGRPTPEQAAGEARGEPEEVAPKAPPGPSTPMRLGDKLAAKARRLKKRRAEDAADESPEN